MRGTGLHLLTTIMLITAVIGLLPMGAAASPLADTTLTTAPEIGGGPLAQGALPQAARVAGDVAAGVGSGSTAGNVFAPQMITVPLGSTVRWTITSDEPHTITFVPPAGPPPPGPPPLWPANVAAGGTVRVDGRSLVNTGIIFKPAQVSATFPTAGTFAYFCAIHPGMDGIVQVAVAGQPVTTAEAAADAIRAQTSAVLGLAGGARELAMAGFASEPQADGHTRWTVPVGAMAETPTGPLEILEYFPAQVAISAGDTVYWVAAAPHSVTFAPADGLPPGDPLELPPAKPSDQYDGQSLYHSGILAFGPPGSPADFELSFPNPGVYPYLCILHGPLGHTGVVIVL